MALVPAVTTDSLPGGSQLPVGCSLSGASPNVTIAFFIPAPPAAGMALSATAASPFGSPAVSITPSTLAALNAALAAFAPTSAGQAPAVYAFWAAYALFAKAGGA